MGYIDESWTTQQLVEFLSVISSFPDEQSAMRGAVERAAEALEAEVGALVSGTQVLACTGFSTENMQAALLVGAAEGDLAVIEVPGAGSCSVIAVPLEDGEPARLVLARGGGEAFSRQENNLLRGMGRVLALTLRLRDERAQRELSERQAHENARLVATLRQRERELQEKTGELRHQALHDALTGLPNRVLALDRAEQMLARARRGQIPVAALYVDVDGFKDVNDTFGHAAGDELLQIVATRLTGVIREGDTAARLGGDEFVVLVEGSTLIAGPELVAERMLTVLREPYDLGETAGRELTLTASVGIAVGVRANADELIRDADLALYAAKAGGRNRYALFESSMQSNAHDRLLLEMDLAEALDADALFLVYQPTFSLQTEEIIGVEALLRWEHPTRGTISPDDFIPIAERSGLIVPIGRWVLREACRRAAIWHADGHALGIAVNVSARQLNSDDLIDDVRDALHESGIKPGSLTLEVTETTIMHDAGATAKLLHRLKDLGVRIAIDDFGTGYSSLAYLRQFPADALKIDRSFISGIASSKDSKALIHTLVQLGRTLEIETLAEGIEDRAQLETLQRENCDQGQGFLFSRPLSVEALEQFLDAVDRAPPSRQAQGATG